MSYRTLSLAAFLLVIGATTVTCQAQLVELSWNGGTGTKLWQSDPNWSGPFPNDALKIANLSVNLGANLSVDLGASGDITVAGVSLGSQSAAVATDIFSSGAGTARLVFRNDDTEVVMTGMDADFDNNTVVDGRDFLIWQRGFGITGGMNINNMGDANNDGNVNQADLVIWQAQYGLGSEFQTPGSPYIESIGVSGATNTINANIHARNEAIEVGGTRPLTINGNISFEGDMTTGISSAGLRVMNPGLVATVNGTINLIDSDMDDANDFFLNGDPQGQNQGTLIMNGVISGAGDLSIGTRSSQAFLPLGTVRLNVANTHTGGTVAARGNLEVNHNNALGTGSYRVDGGTNAFGVNMISTANDRVIPNNIVLARPQTVKGTNSLEFSGAIEQTNNSSMVNMSTGSAVLKLSGRINVWEDTTGDATDDKFETTLRDFTFEGTGRTEVTGMIRDLPDSAGAGIFAKYGVIKSGTGSLLINVAAGENNHNGRTIVRMGNFHYANNGSLNASFAPESKIFSRGGAIGVDVHPVGQNLGTNTTFLDKIDPTSTGGLMLASTDTNTALDFTTGSRVNAANMSVAAPEGGISYTGTITPAGSTYKLGGGVGTLTLPNATLTGGNSLVVMNGGTVKLLGDNTYTGATRVLNKYSSSVQAQAAADTTNNTSTLFYNQVAPVLEVDDLANAGSASSIGAPATTAASNLLIQGSTLRYNGTGDSTNRLFTIGTAGARIESTGSGAVVFANTGSIVSADATNKTGDLRSVAPGNPGTLYNLSDTSDIVVGMTVRDPDPSAGNEFLCGGGVVFTGANCIPANTTVTGVSPDGKEITISAPYPNNMQKLNTTLVFGPIGRTLTLAGSNTGDNTIASALSNSAGGGALAVTKTGAGKWILSGSNTYTGDTTVEAGILSMNNTFLADASAVRINGGILDLNFGGSDIIGSLFFNGAQQPNGTYGRLGHPTATFKSAFFTGNGLLNVGGVPLGALAAVPEPNALVLVSLASLALVSFRRRAL